MNKNLKYFRRKLATNNLQNHWIYTHWMWQDLAKFEPTHKKWSLLLVVKRRVPVGFLLTFYLKFWWCFSFTLYFLWATTFRHSFSVTRFNQCDRYLYYWHYKLPILSQLIKAPQYHIRAWVEIWFSLFFYLLPHWACFTRSVTFRSG